MIKMFYSPNCKKCPEARRFMKVNNIPYEAINTKEDDGMLEAIEHNIMKLPAFSVNGVSMSFDEFMATI